MDPREPSRERGINRWSAQCAERCKLGCGGKPSGKGPHARDLAGRLTLLLRFTTDLTVGFTSNQAERDVRPVKVQMRTSGGCWRTLEGLADFAIVQSYLSTAGKWGIDKLDALTQLFTTGPWLPPDIRPG